VTGVFKYIEIVTPVIYVSDGDGVSVAVVGMMNAVLLEIAVKLPAA
jgi:hypothetical protein